MRDIEEVRRVIERVEEEMRNRVMEGCEKYVPRKEVKQNRKKWFNYKTENNQSMCECYEKYAKIKHDSKSNPRDENRRVEYENAQKEWDEIVLNAKRKARMEMVNRVTKMEKGKYYYGMNLIGLSLVTIIRVSK